MCIFASVSEPNNFWYIVFVAPSKQVMFGYFTVKFLKESNHLANTTVVSAEHIVKPDSFDENEDYVFSRQDKAREAFKL